MAKPYVTEFVVVTVVFAALLGAAIYLGVGSAQQNSLAKQYDNAASRCASNWEAWKKGDAELQCAEAAGGLGGTSDDAPCQNQCSGGITIPKAVNCATE